MANKEYIILDSNKRPLHEFKNGGKSWDEVKDFNNIGLIVPEPYIVLDFDSVDESRLMLKIIEALDIECKVMKTTRGIHVWFKSSTTWKNFVKTRLAVDLLADCRSYGKNGYVKIKDNGELREWLRDCPEETVSHVPKWLYPVTGTGKNFAFKGMKSGDGRNQELFNYIIFLQTKGFTKDEIKETITIINRFIFAEPIGDRELNTILRDESFKSEQEINQLRNIKPLHNVIAEELIEDFKIITINGLLYIYKDNYYKQAQIELEREMINRYPDIKQQLRKEVLEYLKLKTFVNRENIKTNPYIINLVNCRLDIATGKQLEHTCEAVDFERVPVIYDPYAYCEDVDKLLNKVFCNDVECVELFEEILGDCLLHKNIYQKAFLFYGSGSNGKSTILKLIRKLVGTENTATIPLDQLVRTFQCAELENKLVNIGDDINYKPMRDTGTLKKLFSGEPMVVERKYRTPFTLEPYATHLFSCNEIPRNADRSDGMTRRWCFVPFNARFSKNDSDYDPLIFEKVSTEEALSYLLNRAIKGFKRLRARGFYTEPKVVKDAMSAYAIANSSILSWVEEEDLTLSYILETPRDTLYKLYSTWCTESNIAPSTKQSFYKELIHKYSLSTKQKKSDGKRYFVKAVDF